MSTQLLFGCFLPLSRYACLLDSGDNPFAPELRKMGFMELTDIVDSVRWLETGEMPHGVCRRDWEKKVRAWRRMAWFMLG